MERKRDELFDAMIEVLRIDPAQLTRSARGRINRALKELREVAATAADIRVRASAYRKRWPKVDLTATALAANWPRLVPDAVTTEYAERVLQRWLMEHQSGTPRTYVARQFAARLTQNQKQDGAIRSMLERLALPAGDKREGLCA